MNRARKKSGGPEQTPGGNAVGETIAAIARAEAEGAALVKAAAEKARAVEQTPAERAETRRRELAAAAERELAAFTAGEEAGHQRRLEAMRRENEAALAKLDRQAAERSAAAAELLARRLIED